MACVNGSLLPSSSSLSSLIFVSDLPSYGLIGFVSIGLILYVAYIIASIRNYRSSSSTTTSVYIRFAQLSLFLLLLSPISFLFRPSSSSTNIVCSTQTLALQILPFCLLLGFNVHFAHQWLLTTTHSSNRSCLVAISSFLIFFLAVLIQSGILLVWFYYNYNGQIIIEQCHDECRRPLFLCSLILNFFLLFLFSLQSSIRYHLYNYRTDCIRLLISLLALCGTIIWIGFYLFIPLKKSSLLFYWNKSYILAYGTLILVYAFLGPLLFEQLFYRQTTTTTIHVKEHRHKPNKVTFKCLSLTKEQQRAFMAAYIKRNLTASCENLTTITISSPSSIGTRHRDENSGGQQSSQTLHSKLSVDSLCPTLASTVSHDHQPPALPLTTTDTSSCGTMTSEYLLLSNSALINCETKH